MLCAVQAHRLKNDSTLTNRALDSLPCKRRVLLSGTPMQNHLDEFYAMVDFCNPGCLGTPADFRRHFESPILAGQWVLPCCPIMHRLLGGVVSQQTLCPLYVQAWNISLQQPKCDDADKKTEHVPVCGVSCLL